jgi:ribulose-phosphate 3-epimerase
VDSIRSIRSWDSDIDIEVDGGINEATGEKCVDAGATTLCSGSYVFSFDEPKLGIDILRNL